MDTDYKMLSAAPFIFRMLSWTAVVFGVVAGVIVLAGGVLPEIPQWMGLLILITGAFYFFIFAVVSDCINLLREIRDKIRQA